MNASFRMPLLLAFLIGVFVAATALAAAMLASFGDPLVLAVAAMAVATCVVAGVIGWLLLRAVQQQDALELPELAELHEEAPEPAPVPARIEALPPAELPPAYLAAVMKGIAANRAAMRSRELH